MITLNKQVIFTGAFNETRGILHPYLKDWVEMDSELNFT